ncbi:nuclear transport factor 2 family protein [Roseomonas sp. E05]|uniref:nuclear transport factor 2 family protein n=1 Tax=Roseomonas sp. E05 TaxID=3046310 RepID=UPI0024B9C43A|nr:nuclear transport factor 2 family protein [Roseomonas sp. E05]MDJ0390948.1 nuclear transport factor 2 family protein [Roseomonas sp. E05]
MPTPTPLAMHRFAASLIMAALAGCAEMPAPSPAAQVSPAAQQPGSARALAVARLQAIAQGDIEAIQRGYADDAILQWVGGPLDGVYQGRAQLAAPWQRFAAAQGVLHATFGASSESANPRGATVITPVIFVGQGGTIKVRHVVVIRGGQVVDEIWQVDPALTL